MKWGKFFSKIVISAFSGFAIGIFTFFMSSKNYEESIVKLWASESKLLNENMTLNEAKQAFENEIKLKESEINSLKITLSEKEQENEGLQSELNDQNSEYDVVRLENAKKYAEDEDYESAIKQLNEITKNDPETDALKEEYTDKYILECIKMVDDYVANGDFDMAVSSINNSLKIVPDNKVLVQLLNETEAKKPIKLSDIGIGDYNNFSDYVDSYVYDTTGKKHSGENVYTIDADDYEAGYIRVYLGKEYSKVKGYMAVSENSPVGRPLSGHIEVNLDGEQKEYYDVPDRAISPIEFEVPVNDVDWFEIKYKGSYFSLAYGYESFEIVISDVYLYK